MELMMGMVAVLIALAAAAAVWIAMNSASDRAVGAKVESAATALGFRRANRDTVKHPKPGQLYEGVVHGRAITFRRSGTSTIQIEARYDLPLSPRWTRWFLRTRGLGSSMRELLAQPELGASRALCGNGTVTPHEERVEVAIYMPELNPDRLRDVIRGAAELSASLPVTAGRFGAPPDEVDTARMMQGVMRNSGLTWNERDATYAAVISGRAVELGFEAPSYYTIRVPLVHRAKRTIRLFRDNGGPPNVPWVTAAPTLYTIYSMSQALTPLEVRQAILALRTEADAVVVDRYGVAAYVPRTIAQLDVMSLVDRLIRVAEAVDRDNAPTGG